MNSALETVTTVLPLGLGAAAGYVIADRVIRALLKEVSVLVLVGICCVAGGLVGCDATSPYRTDKQVFTKPYALGKNDLPEDATAQAAVVVNYNRAYTNWEVEARSAQYVPPRLHHDLNALFVVMAFVGVVTLGCVGVRSFAAYLIVE